MENKEAKRIKKCLYVVGASTIVTGLSIFWSFSKECGLINLCFLGFNIWAFKKVNGYLRELKNGNL
jgi:hypothetical protein